MSKLKFYLIFTLLFYSCWSVSESSAQTWAMSKTSSSQAENEQDSQVSIIEALNELSQTYEVFFTYNTAHLKSYQVSTEYRQAKDVNSSLKKLLEKSNLRFKKRGKNNFVVVEKTTQPVGKLLNDFSSSQPVTPRFPQLSDALETTITGKVTDLSTGEELPGVNILVKGTSIGTITDVEGNYRLAAPDDAQTLVFSSVGYTSEEITIGNQRVINLELTPDIQSLNEVVVVGYGTQKKENLSSAIASVPGEELGEVSTDAFSRALAGKVAGVQIQQTTGAPGANISVRVRGSGSLSANNNPLYVIDGFPVEQSGIGASDQGFNPLSSINPSDILSIQVLKDAAAAAIYGSRGANGVVLITTKQGSAGQTKFNFAASLGTQQVLNKIDLMNSGEYLDFAREAFENAAATSSPGLPLPDFLANESQLRTIDTDWQDQIFRNALVQNYQLSASGGSDNLQYFVSGGYLSEEGVVISSGFERFSFRTNLNADLTNRIRLGVNLNPSYTVNDEVNAEGHWADNAVINQSLINFPFLRPDESSEEFVNNDPNYDCCGVPNPVRTAEDFDATSTQFRTLGTAYLEVDLLDELTAKTSLGVDITDWERNVFEPASIRRNNMDNGASSRKLSRRSWLTENTLNYTGFFGAHSVSVLGGFTYQEFREQDNLIEANQLPNDLVRTINDFNTVTRATSEIQQWSLVSFLARVNYSFQNKYLLTAVVRRDGSSRFGENNRYATFPSISAGWAISEENFLQNIEVLSQLKLRASYGETGNNNIGNYSAIGLLEPTNYVLGNGNGTGVTGLRPSNISNRDLTWETTRQVDIGIDAGLFNQRISLIADYYISNTEDLLLNVPIPTITGFGSALQNLGRVRNTGWEFTLNTQNYVNDFKWSTGFNITFSQNEILELGPEGDPIRGGSGAGNIFINEIGGELGSFSVYEQVGIFQTQEEIDNSATWDTNRGTFPGDVKYRDQNDDGVIDADDRIVIGSNQPDFVWGLTNNFSYHNFDLNIVVNGVQGNLVHNVARRFYDNLEGNQNQSTMALERWRSPSEPGNGVTPRANRVTSGNNNIAESSRWVEDASFIRIQNITLGYNLPQSLVGNLKIDSFRLYAAVSNLAYFTEYTGYNPEVSLNGGDPLRNGADYGSYPLARRFTLGVNVGF